MIHIVRDLFHHQYTWEDIKRSELTELYIAMMIRRLGISLVGIFIPLYLYNLGYSVETVLLFVSSLYFIRIFTDVIGAKIIGYYGPKHVMIIANIFLILAFSMLLSIEQIQWPLALVAFTYSVANGMFFVAYHIEFSKIQSSKKAGAQISKMFRVGKFAGAIGPLLGGIISSFYGVPLTIFLAITFILISAFPLALSPEPVRRRQHVTFKGFPWRSVRRDLISNLGLGFDQVTDVIIWPLYVALFVVAGDEYVGVGVAVSVGLAVSFFASGHIGKLIDRTGGAGVLKAGVIGSSLGHLLRVFVNSTPLAVIFGAFNDPALISMRMPYIKGMYNAASSHEGYRDAYIAAIMVMANLARASVPLVALVAIIVLDSIQAGLQIAFVFTAVAIWLATLHRYKSLQ